MGWVLWALATGTICYIMFLYGESRREQGYIQAVKDLTGISRKE